MPTNTIRLRRVIRSKPEKVYRAFLEAGALCKWLPPSGYFCTMHEMDAKVGGGFKFSFTNFTTGAAHSSSGKYLELVPSSRIRYSGRFGDPNLPGELETTVTLKEVFCGTDVEIVQAGVPAAIPEAACQIGWHQSLLQLADLVEPEIPN